MCAQAVIYYLLPVLRAFDLVLGVSSAWCFCFSVRPFFFPLRFFFLFWCFSGLLLSFCCLNIFTFSLRSDISPQHPNAYASADLRLIRC